MKFRSIRLRDLWHGLWPPATVLLGVTFIGTLGYVIVEEMSVGDGSEVAGRHIDDIEAQVPRIRIVALKRSGETIQVAPRGQVRAGDHLVVVGARDSLERLTGLVGG